MPLPVFPKSRKWKSCNAIPGPIPLNNKYGINKTRSVMRYQNDAIMSTKQALKKEIVHWQELVVMAQKKVCDPMRLANGLENGDIIFRNDIIQNYDNDGAKTYKKTEQTQHSNGFNLSCNPNGTLRLQKGMTKHVQLNNGHNGIRNALMKGPVKRGKFSTLQGEIHSIRKQERDERKEVLLDTSTSNPPLMENKISPIMRTV